jgi:hypothetical protein
VGELGGGALCTGAAVSVDGGVDVADVVGAVDAAAVFEVVGLAEDGAAAR